jgi:hypothetical protein
MGMPQVRTALACSVPTDEGSAAGSPTVEGYARGWTPPTVAGHTVMGFFTALTILAP